MLSKNFNDLIHIQKPIVYYRSNQQHKVLLCNLFIMEWISCCKMVFTEKNIQMKMVIFKCYYDQRWYQRISLYGHNIML